MATTADLTRIMMNCRVRLPGAIDSAIRVELYNVMNEFFQETNLWQDDITVTTQAGKLVYYIQPNSYGVIDKLVAMQDAQKRIYPCTFTMPDTITFSFDPGVLTLNARVIMTISDPVDRDGYPEFPPWVAGKYNSAIADGVLGKMMAQMSKPYTDEKKAIYHLRKFETAKAMAKGDAARFHTFGVQSWRFPTAGIPTRRFR